MTMAFTTFLDNLALIEVLLLLAAATLAYGGLMAWWAIRTNDEKGLRSVLHGMAIPLGGVGIAITALAMWGEMTWPFLASDGMAGYNIFFFDPLLLFGLVLVAYAASAYLTVRMQYVGLFALIAGAVTIFYGWSGYTAHPAFTKDPLDTLLLYTAFGGAGIFAFPATVVMDYYCWASDKSRLPWVSSPVQVGESRPRGLGVRGVQPIAPAPPTEAGTTETATHFHVPLWAQGLLLVFPVVATLAAIAALWYFGVTLPGHLGGGPAAAP
jgi:putative membrane protein